MRSDSVASCATLDLKRVEPNDLVRRIQLGCPDSATELSNRYTPRLHVLLERRLPGRQADVEDIAQESLARAFQSLDRFDFQYQFSTWLYTIAFRLSSDLLRKESRRPRTVSIELANVDGSIEFANEPRPVSEKVENIWNVARSILSESQFSILWLKYGEGLSIQEIARVLGKTTIGVRVQLHRARSKIAKEFSRMDAQSARNEEK